MLCTASNHFVLDVHRPVVVKRAVIGSKGGWKLSTIFLSCKVLHDWSIIKLRKYIVFIRRRRVQ